jgi:heme exporter protein B
MTHRGFTWLPGNHTHCSTLETSPAASARDVLLPLLLFPMMVPVLLAAIQASKALFGADLMQESGAWMRLLFAYDPVFLIITHLAFEYVIEV